MKQFGIDKWAESDITVSVLRYLNTKFSLIIHCAGSGSVSYSYMYPEEDFKKTVVTTLAVLEYMRLYNKDAHLIYPSSGAVYGNVADKPIPETHRCQPVSPYGFHKKITEDLCESYAKNFALHTTIIRFFSLYGIGLKKQLLWDACSKLSSKKKIIEFFGTGKETRDGINIQDALHLIHIVSKIKNTFAIFNGGSGVKYTTVDIVQLIYNEFSKNQIIRFNEIAKIGDPPYNHADITKAKKMHWKPHILLHKGIKEYVQWFKEQNR